MKLDPGTGLLISYLLLIVLGFGAFGAAFLARRRVIGKQTLQIVECLTAKGAADVTVAWVGSRSGINHYAYDVEYMLRGQRCRNSCQVWLGRGGEIYWKDPV